MSHWAGAGYPHCREGSGAAWGEKHGGRSGAGPAGGTADDKYAAECKKSAREGIALALPLLMHPPLAHPPLAPPLLQGAGASELADQLAAADLGAPGPSLDERSGVAVKASAVQCF